MMSYLMKGADPEDFETIHAVMPALPGTYLGYASSDGSTHHIPVIGWGIVSNGTPEPLTLDGVWGGADQANTYVLFPDGKCARFENCWPDEAACITELGEREPK